MVGEGQKKAARAFLSVLGEFFLLDACQTRGDSLIFLDTASQQRQGSTTQQALGSRLRRRLPRMQCQNNLKQFGLAVHNYHDTFGQFPNANVGSSLSGGSLFTAILPMMEQASAFQMYDPGLPNSHPTNVRVSGQQIPFYLCPSASMRRQVPGCDSDQGRAPGTYAASIGTRDFDQYWSFRGQPRPSLNGTIVYTDTVDGKTAFRDQTDGTSQTLLIGETAYNLPDYKFRSDHVGGVQFLFADGSVHFLSDSIDAATLDALATRNGGEVINASF